MRFVLPLGCALLAALSLTACGQNKVTTDTASGPPVDTLGGVDLNGNLSVIGTEPFWALKLAQGQITLEGPDKAPTQWPRTSFFSDDSQSVELLSDELTLVLTATPCSDGMSDRKYPLTAEATIGDGVLKGCAISTAELEKFRP